MPTTTTTTPTSPPKFAFAPGDLEREAWKAGVLGALNLATTILAARLIVLIAVVGGIVLTWSALGDPNALKAAVLAIYAGFVVGPSIWLASR